MSGFQSKEAGAVPASKGAKEIKDTLASGDGEAREARIREVAMRHALSIQEKKNLQGKVLDMILTAYDLPSPATTDPAHPDSTDAITFRDCLRIWRPSDLDELVQERNLVDRCGYALCRRAKQKQRPTKVWDKKQGTFVDKPFDLRWCSNECKERNDFVRRQLGTDPAWLRQEQNQGIALLTDSQSYGKPDDPLSTRQQQKNVTTQAALALERGQTNATQLEDIPIREKATTAEPEPPTFTPQLTVSDVLEGMPLRQTGNNLRGG
ncbi:hypothetical protein LTR70_007789 [Exophiala xenobiotica]|uniref:RNA polymerase II subunit B1 CTD phosphatase RPAP2 homolog n=1 Tax=Lithohypha guttulata TaxID=1690604 RepID=A0ABR0K1B5_9EURO|nr:hypothetical protein LTR24_008611 [Lithohypha guttulata]KAK5313097.1 hypothetical protein LTR70_007789 [Exophiala xenobiotica]